MSTNLDNTIAGDTSGYLDKTAAFVRERFNNVILIGGNHIVYNNEWKSIQELCEEYRKEFPIDDNISFLENDYKIIDDVVFIGATLWTDYEYGGTYSQNMRDAFDWMNDFRYGRYRLNNGQVVRLHPEYCLNMFQESLAFIKEAYDKFADSGKKIILITHHAPSPKAICERYLRFSTNAAYVSDLEDYIKTNLPKLSLIIHGHIHNRIKYKIGDIPVIANPCGYIPRGEECIKPAWKKDLIVEI